MNIKQSTLAAAVTATLAMGMAGQAAASVYARSYLEIENVSIVIGTVNPTTSAITPGGATIDNFNFNLTNTASLNGNPVIDDAACTGTPAANNCNPAANTGLATVGTRLDAAAVNSPGGDVTRTNNSFVFFGPGTDQYSNSDSVIYTAQVTGDTSTHTEQIAEAELQSGFAAASSSEIQSTTGFTFTFSTTTENVFYMDFDAFLDILAAINDPTASSATSQANVKVEIKLANDSTGDFFQWSPNGPGGSSGCATTFGTCAVLADDFDINGDVGVSTDGQSAGRSNVGGMNNNFTLFFTGLFAGDWTLTLDTLTSTSLSRVPEPGILALMGVGLMGLGLSARRRKLA